MHETAERIKDEIVCEIFCLIGRERGGRFRIARAVLRREINEKRDAHHVPRESAVAVEELEIFAVIGRVEEDLQLQMVAGVLKNALQDFIRVKQRRVVIIDVLRMPWIADADIALRQTIAIRVVTAHEAKHDEMRAGFRDFFQTFQDLRVVASAVFSKIGFRRVFGNERARHVSVRRPRIADEIRIVSGFSCHIGNRNHVRLFPPVVLIEIREVHRVRLHRERVIGVAVREKEETGVGRFFRKPRRRVDGIIRLKRFHVRAIGRLADDEKDGAGKGRGRRIETEFLDILRVKTARLLRFGQIFLRVRILGKGKQFLRVVMNGNGGRQEQHGEDGDARARHGSSRLRSVSPKDEKTDGKKEKQKSGDGSGKDAVAHVRGNESEDFLSMRQKDGDHIALRKHRVENAPIADGNESGQREIRDENRICGGERRAEPWKARGGKFREEKKENRGHECQDFIIHPFGAKAVLAAEADGDIGVRQEAEIEKQKPRPPRAVREQKTGAHFGGKKTKRARQKIARRLAPSPHVMHPDRGEPKLHDEHG